MTTNNTHMVAEFPLVNRAVKFAERISDPASWYALNITRHGRTVEWDADTTRFGPGNDLWHYTMDMLETVGYYGSDERRKATLNGMRAPMSY